MCLGCFRKYTIKDMETVYCHTPGSLKGLKLLHMSKDTH